MSRATQNASVTNVLLFDANNVFDRSAGGSILNSPLMKEQQHNNSGTTPPRSPQSSNQNQNNQSTKARQSFFANAVPV